MYSVPLDKWVHVAVNFFKGVAACWLQSVEHKVYKSSWHEFCVLFLDRFGRDEHDLLIRKMLHIKQTGTVTEYISQFVELIDQLAAYESPADPRHYTMKFIDGLRHDICSTIFVQLPKDLDTACTLAALQEEMMDLSPLKESKKTGISFPSKTLYPLPAPPSDRAKPALVKQQSSNKVPTNQDKLGALKAYRKAMGQCFKCGEKWSSAHTCQPTIQLHVVQELWELFQLGLDDQDSSSQAELYVAISKEALTGTPTIKTLKLMGTIQGLNLTILIDSGSSNTFISHVLASQLHGGTPISKLITVQVANGEKLQCQTEFKDVWWSVQNCTFQNTLKVFPMDSLEQFSPMQVRWQQKWLLIPYEGQWVKL
jgi:hypothetical protein